jgi:L-fuconolactonase
MGYARDPRASASVLPVRSPGSDPLAIWHQAAALQIPVSSLSSPEGFTSPHLAQVVKEFPSLPIIIERLGGIGRDEAPPHPKFRQILALAQYPNIYIYTKIHGLGEICQRPIPFPEPMRFLSIPPFMEMAYDAFGASWVMWGSDFPPVAGREGYCNALHWTMDHIPSRTAAAKEWMFGKTALSLFNFAG